MSKITNYH